MKLKLLMLVSVSAVAVAAGGVALSRMGQGVARAEPASDATRTAASHGAASPATRRAFFGELHLHTGMSLDAWTFGTKILPDQAYRFARGETVMVPAVQLAAEQGLSVPAEVPARRAWPLDFAAVTDHSEYLGAMHQLDDPSSAFSKSPTGIELKAAGRGGFQKGEAIVYGPPTAATLDLRAAANASNAWALEVKAAADNNRPGKFTTFVAYEWTATAGYGTHLHRNVIFNSDRPPNPFTANDSSKPEDLWKYLDSVRGQGIGVLAIPHNSNLSDGIDFDWNMSNGRPIDEAYALERALNEPLVEIAQTKGASETTPELSSSDEFANFEIKDRLYRDETKPNQHGSYVREAYGRGLVIQVKVGANPFKMGIVGASDIHNGLSVSDESGYAGGISGLDPKGMLPRGDAARRALGMGKAAGTGRAGNDPLQFSSGAITGVWAEENTRGAIFAALNRKETFATSGTRIRLRMFSGWGFDPKIIQNGDWVSKAYAQGTPMGGDLPARPKSAKAPRFILQAMKDPDGANLDRIQVIKVWLDHGTYREKVFDVALSGGRKVDARRRAPPVGDTVDLTTGTYKNTIGAPMLSSVWQDPEFDPLVPAVYYARALEIPTPRWSTLLALRNKLPLPTRAPATIQERAWSSPIWFTPEGSAPRG